MSANLHRAGRAENCLDHYRTLAGDKLGSDDAITDLVADLGHFCIENDLTYLHLLSRGVSHWRLEMTDPDAIGPMPEVSIIINERNDHA